MIEGLYAFDSTISLCLLLTFALLGWMMWREFCHRPTTSDRHAERHPHSRSGEPNETRLPGPTLIPLAAVLVGVSLYPAVVLDHLGLTDSSESEPESADASR